MFDGVDPIWKLHGWDPITVTINGLFCPSKCVTSGKLLFIHGHGGGGPCGGPGCANKNVGNNINNNNCSFLIVLFF